MTELKIEGMTCNHCVMAVREALAAVPGVSRVVEVSLEGKSARVAGDASAAALVAAVQQAGYQAQAVD
jgi:copper chaperone